MIPTKRILTRKSLLKFGKFKDYTVQRLLDLDKKQQLISAYFKITNIDYQENILIELGITDKWVISKPGKDLDMYYSFLRYRGHRRRLRTREGADGMKKEPRTISRAALQRINHNKM